MIERIKHIITGLQDVDGWKIIERSSLSRELFFTRRELDMNRVKEVCQYEVTVYQDTEEQGTRYRGAAVTNIHPTMQDAEISKAIKRAVFDAGFIKNPYYPLTQPVQREQPAVPSKFSGTSLQVWLPGLIDAVYAADAYEEGWLNSLELFLEQQITRIVNSEGIDVSFTGYNGYLEYIANWRGTSEEVELFNTASFADYRPEEITESVKDLLEMCKERAMAQPTPPLKKHTVLLTGDPVKEIIRYYYDKSNVRSVYEGVSTLKIGDNVQGEDVRGDQVTLGLDPFLANSTASRPYDQDGFPLAYVEVFNQGILQQYWGETRFAHYLGVPPTGRIANMVVQAGSKSLAELRSEPYLEVLAFSDFQVNTLTGTFIGEIRLGRYFDGEKEWPVSGGSVSGNLLEMQKEMYFSQELQWAPSRVPGDLNYRGPKTIQLFNVTVAGQE